MVKKHDWYYCTWTLQHVRNGKVIWEQKDIRNALADEGEKNMLNVYFRQTNEPTSFYLRLCNDSLLETDTLSAVQNEPAGNGYAPQELGRSVTGFPTIELDSGNYQVVSAVVEFTASGGNIGPVNTAYLATTQDNTGLLICYQALSTSRTVLENDIFRANLTIKVENASTGGFSLEGYYNMLDTYFRQANQPTEFYLRLCNDTLAGTDTLSDVQNEPSGSGYTPALIERSVTGFPTLALDSGDYQVESKEVQFAAVGGDIGPVNTAYLATTSDDTGVLVGYKSLPIARTITDSTTGLEELKIKAK